MHDMLKLFRYFIFACNHDAISYHGYWYNYSIVNVHEIYIDFDMKI